MAFVSLTAIVLESTHGLHQRITLLTVLLLVRRRDQRHIQCREARLVLAGHGPYQEGKLRPGKASDVLWRAEDECSVSFPVVRAEWTAARWMECVNWRTGHFDILGCAVEVAGCSRER